MKTVIITRKKKFAGALVPYWIIGASIADGMPDRFQTPDTVQVSEAGFPIPTLHPEMLAQLGAPVKNGETVTIDVPDEETAIYAVTMDGILSNRAELENGVQEGGKDVFHFILTTTGGFARPSCPVFLPGTEE